MCLDVVLFGLIFFGTLCFLELDVLFLPHVREFFSYCVLKDSLCHFSFFPFRDPCNTNVSVLGVVSEVS